MRIMRLMRQIRGFGGLSLFCSGLRPCTALATLAKQILWGRFWQNCLILPHLPHEIEVYPHHHPISRVEMGDFMRIMRVDEVRLFIGKILPYGNMGCRDGDAQHSLRSKHEAVMRMHEAGWRIQPPIDPTTTVIQ